MVVSRAQFWRPGVQEEARRKLLDVATKLDDMRDEIGPDAEIVRLLQEAESGSRNPLPIATGFS